jgi:hypothetical protein
MLFWVFLLSVVSRLSLGQRVWLSGTAFFELCKFLAEKFVYVQNFPYLCKVFNEYRYA